MRNVVTYPDHKTQQYRGNHGGIVHKFDKTVDGVKLVVIAETKKEVCWLISGWQE